MSWTAQDLAQACGGRLEGNGDLSINGVSTDSRNLQRGSLFVAIQGDRFDGHAFVEEAARQGVGAVLIAKNGLDTGEVPKIRVDDTVAALGRLAHARRLAFDHPVIAITGSNGKTTTKEICADILETAGRTVCRTQGNLNNHIGLPLSILALSDQDDVLVVELGMNHAGEIDVLAAITSPDIGAITQVAPAHLGPLGSIEAIARAKGELLDHIRPDGTACLNADNAHVMSQASRFAGKQLLFGRSERADIRASRESFDEFGTSFRLHSPSGDCDVRLSQPGEVLVEDSLCAAACVFASGLLGDRVVEGIQAGLEVFDGIKGRMKVRRASGGFVVLDDTYNANPDSVSHALTTLLHCRGGGRAIAVLGDMLELGADEDELHRDIGRQAAALGIDRVISVGPLAAHIVAGAREAGLSAADEASDTQDAAARVLQDLRPGDVVLVKGSRAMRMEATVQNLLENA